MTPNRLVDRLLDTDPALRRQVERDLLDAPDEVWRATQEWFAVDGPVGEPSPWLTPYATRVPRWWDGNSGEDQQ